MTEGAPLSQRLAFRLAFLLAISLVASRILFPTDTPTIWAKAGWQCYQQKHGTAKNCSIALCLLDFALLMINKTKTVKHHS